MIRILITRFKQGYRTHAYPKKTLVLPESYRGCPEVAKSASKDAFKLCAQSCPQGAIDAAHQTIDLGQCVFCGACERDFSDCVHFTNNYDMAAVKRAQLITDGAMPHLAPDAKGFFRRLFGRSLQLRQVSAGGCNACEADLNVLNTPFFDLARFGIQFVASPRHADGLVVTGPVTRNMRTALLKTYHAMPSPKLVIAVGSCAISGGPFRGSAEVCNGVDTLLPVDLYIPGCPVHPMTTLSALIAYFKK